MSNEVLAHQFKLLRPLLDRAQEIQGVDPLTAYYTKMYAVQEGIKIPKRHPDISALISKVMNEMEAAKPKLTLGGPETDRFHVEAFALKVFAGADKLDRAGRRDESTMKRYFAASQFFRVLEQFGPLDQQMENMRKYAAYRAVLIRKALKSGTECPPPPETTEVGAEELALEQELDAYALAGAAVAAPAAAAAPAPPPPAAATAPAMGAPPHLHPQSPTMRGPTATPPPPPQLPQHRPPSRRQQRLLRAMWQAMRPLPLGRWRLPRLR